MSSCPFTSAFHCSLGLNSDAPGYTCTSSSTPAALASRAMICTISSRASPLPPGNWCEALSGCAWALAASARTATAPAIMIAVFFMSPSDFLVEDGPYAHGTVEPGYCQNDKNSDLVAAPLRCLSDRPVRLRGALQNQVRALLADQDRGGVGVAGDQRRHDRGVDHPQAGDAAHAQFRIDHGVGVGPHPAGADRVIDRDALGAHERGD